MRLVLKWGLLAATVFCCAFAQLRNCNEGTDQRILSPTTMQAINMSCPVSPAAVVNSSEGYIWEWLKLAPGSSEELIVDGITSERDISVYNLQIQCASGGIYQALYYNAADNDTCLFGCFFPVQVEETDIDVLREEFETYPVVVNETVPSIPSNGLARSERPGTVQSAGVCGDKFYLSSTCVVSVQPTWYRNGSRFDPLTDEDYILSGSGELRILNLTEATVGYYVCVHSVTALGISYQTHEANIILAPPTTSPPPSTMPPSATTTDMLEMPESLFGTLKAWEFGLIIGIASLIIIVILLSGAVWMGHMTVKRRRANRQQRRVQYKKHNNLRPKSMAQEIQMMDAESIDLGDSSSPVEIPFNCILFEEQLHKGTFKVVHHGVVDHPMQGLLGAEVAIKRLKDTKSELGYEELMNEAVTMRAVQEKAGSHPNIVSMLGLTTQGGPTCLLLDFVPNGTLDDFLVALRLGPTPEWYLKFVRDTLRGAYHKHVSGDLMRIVMQVAEGMKFLTDHGFVHRDLSVRNILMGERLNIKISNPGMQHEGYYYIVSEREHFFQDMAPECLWEKHYSVCSDIWSFGILVYRTVALNTLPFPNMEADELHGRMVGGERPQLLASFSNEMYFLLQRCWQFVATERPSFATIFGDLAHMSEKPTRHIILKVTKDHAKPGYISDNGQVFLRGLLPHALDEDSVPKKSQRSSGTMRSLISSIDDTVYTRETAETVLDSETECYNNYESYLKGDLAAVLPAKTTNRRSYEETDTSGNDASARETQRVKPTSRKTSKARQDPDAKDADSVSASSSKKKKRRVAGHGKAAGMGYANKAFSRTDSPGNSREGQFGDNAELSSDGAPSITEEEDKSSTASEQSESDVKGSQSELVRL